MTREFAGSLAAIMAIGALMAWASEGFETNVVTVVGSVTIVWGVVVGAGFAYSAWRARE